MNNALIDFQFNGDARPRRFAELTAQKLHNNNSMVLWLRHLIQLRAALEDMQNAHFGRIVNIGTNLVQNPVRTLP